MFFKIVFIFGVFSTSFCFAYIDLSTGSVLAQVVIATSVGFAFAFKNALQKIWKTIIKPFSVKKKNGQKKRK